MAVSNEGPAKTKDRVAVAQAPAIVALFMRVSSKKKPCREVEKERTGLLPGGEGAEGRGGGRPVFSR